MRRPQKGKTPITPTKDLGQAPDFYKISMFAPLPQIDDADRKTIASRAPGTPERPPQDCVKTPTDEQDIDCAKAPDTPKGTAAGLNKVSPDREGDKTSLMKTEDGTTASSNSAVESSPKPTETLSGEMLPSASPLSASPNPQTDQFGPALSPSDIGGTFVDVPNSAGNSISSWNDQPDHDILWSSGSLLNTNHHHGGYSPHGSPGGFHHFPRHLQHPPQHPYNPPPQTPFGQVTPPEGGRPLVPRRTGEMMRNVPPMPPPLPDGSGLSPADLNYLTHQNRILLDQAHSRTGNDSKRKKH